MMVSNSEVSVIEQIVLPDPLEVRGVTRPVKLCKLDEHHRRRLILFTCPNWFSFIIQPFSLNQERHAQAFLINSFPCVLGRSWLLCCFLLGRKLQPSLGRAVSPINLHILFPKREVILLPQVIDIKVIVPKFINGETCAFLKAPHPLFEADVN